VLDSGTKKEANQFDLLHNDVGCDVRNNAQIKVKIIYLGFFDQIIF
jgi:hypothetical protein